MGAVDVPNHVPFPRPVHPSPGCCERWQLMVHRQALLWTTALGGTRTGLGAPHTARHPAQQPMPDGYRGTRSWPPRFQWDRPCGTVREVRQRERAAGVTSIHPSRLLPPCPLSSVDKSHASAQALCVDNVTQDIPPVFRCLYKASCEWNSPPTSLDLLSLQNVRQQTRQSPRLF